MSNVLFIQVNSWITRRKRAVSTSHGRGGEAGWLAGVLGVLGLMFPLVVPLQLPILQEWLGKEIFNDKYGAFILEK